MKLTKKRIEILIETYDKFKEHVDNVAGSLGHRGSVESIDSNDSTNLYVTMSDYRCGSYDTEQIKIPLELITCDSTEFARKLAEKQEAERAERDRIYQEKRKLEADRQRHQDLKKLAELKEKYEPTNQGDTP